MADRRAAAGTRQVRELPVALCTGFPTPLPFPVLSPLGSSALTRVGCGAFFARSALPGCGRHELWRTDGTPGGTVVIAEFACGGGEPTPPTDTGGSLFFGAEDGLPGDFSPGLYQVRVIGIGPAGQPVGRFSEAATVTVE